ncbi:MAG: SpoVA/SpoVAEb family sporulation membrane protein [Clostridia bacterium]|nr:SpoVA/SpoVAEb family sporulation membrane protein [Clostridia bacterium]
MKRGGFTDKQRYGELVKRGSPPSPKVKNTLCAFAVGGALCAAAEGVKTLLSSFIADESAVSKWVTIIMIFAGCALTAAGLYDDMAKFAGAGTLVPITGFANAVTSPAMEYRREGIVTGTAVGMFSIAGPVIVFGVGASVVYGVIIYAFGLY